MNARLLQPELLDGLPAHDPRAIGSRRDLRRINAVMGNARHLAGALREVLPRLPPRRIVDFGAGDGAVLLDCLRRLPGLPRGVEVVLLDRVTATPPTALAGLQAIGCQPVLVEAEAMEWLRGQPPDAGGWLLANLFLHHFGDDALRELFVLAAERLDLVCAGEPRRGAWPLAASRLVALLGANAVTRHDAVVSVRAGFRGTELSALWPRAKGWRLRELRAGWFSHLFLVYRA